MLNETVCRARKKLSAVRRGGKLYKIAKIPGERRVNQKRLANLHCANIAGIAEYMSS